MKITNALHITAIIICLCAAACICELTGLPIGWLFMVIGAWLLFRYLERNGLLPYWWDEKDDEDETVREYDDDFNNKF